MLSATPWWVFPFVGLGRHEGCVCSRDILAGWNEAGIYLQGGTKQLQSRMIFQDKGVHPNIKRRGSANVRVIE